MFFFVERDEFRMAMRQIQPDLSIQDIDLLFTIMDQDNNGSISFLEFMAATIDPRDVDVREMNQVQKKKNFSLQSLCEK